MLGGGEGGGEGGRGVEYELYLETRYIPVASHLERSVCVWLRYRNISESCPLQRRGKTRGVARTGFCLEPVVKCHGFGNIRYTVCSGYKIR